MLLDCTHIPHGPLNETLEVLCKSVEEKGLMHPHPTDRLMDAMEAFSTEVVLWRSNAIQAEANRALGVYPELLKKAAPGDMGPKCRNIERQLLTEEPGTLPMELYLQALDCWLWRYLPPAQSAHEASRMAIKQYLAGLSRHSATPKTPGEAMEVVYALPASLESARGRFPLTRFDQERIAVAEASAGRHVQAITARTRAALQDVIIGAERRRIAEGGKAYAVAPIEQQLRDKFGELNRDWRRIAVSETAINASEAYLSRLPLGSKVKWLSHPGACRYCESQSGKIFTVVISSKSNKNPETEVWVGKQAENTGRSISKRKRIETGELVDREPDELVVPAIPAHPICRCLWVPVNKGGPSYGGHE